MWAPARSVVPPTHGSVTEWAVTVRSGSYDRGCAARRPSFGSVTVAAVDVDELWLAQLRDRDPEHYARLMELRDRDPETYAAAMSCPPGCAPTHEPTPAEEAADLEELKALAERRKSGRSLLVRSWERLPEHTRVMLVAAGAVDVPRAEERSDVRLEENIARRERRVWSLRLRGLLPRQLRTREPRRVRPLRLRFCRSPRREARARSCARTPARPGPDRPVDDPRRRAA